jgi:hypothetical protein
MLLGRLSVVKKCDNNTDVHSFKRNTKEKAEKSQQVDVAGGEFESTAYKSYSVVPVLKHSKAVSYKLVYSTTRYRLRRLHTVEWQGYHVRNLTPYIFKTRYNIILPSTHRSRKWSLSFSFTE